MLVLALLAVVAASSVVHAASATSMPVTMALADHALSDEADCEGCDGDSDVDVVCDIACTASFLAGLVEDRAAAPRPAASHAALRAGTLRGRTGAPDPHPPRRLLTR